MLHYGTATPNPANHLIISKSLPELKGRAAGSPEPGLGTTVGSGLTNSDAPDDLVFFFEYYKMKVAFC